MNKNQNNNYQKKGSYNKRKYNNSNNSHKNNSVSNTNKPVDLTAKDVSYCIDFLNAYNAMSNTDKYFLSPQLLNDSLKNINMEGRPYPTEEIRKMVLAPHKFEQELRKLSYFYYNYISIYKRYIDFKASVLDFDWELVPYTLDGKAISQSDINSNAFKRDYGEVSKFFNSFNVKREFKKVLFNVLLYDTYYTSLRTYNGHMYLQELPSKYCMIDATSYLGYLFSFDLSYFMNAGIDLKSFSPELRKKYDEVRRSIQSEDYRPNLPNRRGSWVYWCPLTPDDGWVFKYNCNFAGSVPPLLDMLIDYSKIDKFKDLDEAKQELEAYKVIVATVPRLSNTKSANKADDFAISSSELGKFVATVKDTLNKSVDFKAAPLEDFKAFDFSSTATSDNIEETEISNMLKMSGLSEAVLGTGSSVSAINLYKTVVAETTKILYPQFENFCEYHINKKTKKYKFKINFVGSIFDREDRRKAANEDMERGIITPSIFSSRGIQITDAVNVSNMMYGFGFPDLFKPIKTAATMSSDDKSNAGRNKVEDNELTEAGEQTRDIGANEGKETEDS